ncbi:MAG: peptidoglycan-binding protein [Lachnospiraceae bacterium]|nr:peptidoglycan-binding protein [Lachnospiraceae bacterium]
MNRFPLHALQNDIDKGYLKINVTSKANSKPIKNAKIEIASTGAPNTPIIEATTDSDGLSDSFELPSPPVEYSLEPSDNQPYSEYNLKIISDGFDEVVISGIQILSGEIGIQSVKLTPRTNSSDTPEYNPSVIDAHTLWEYYPPKIAEPEIKPLPEGGEIVLSRVVIPEIVVVHDGAPSDSSATNYYVQYKEYIKNVASSEIYATWPESTIYANVLAIMSFTLNRVYTEWYRGKGYDFTITSSTAFDHKWTKDKTIYENISQIVDSIFANYLSRPDVIQPILTQYCDGKRVTCPNWLSQWGSKALGDQGYSAIEILRNYYGSDIYINESTQISGIPSSWPGYDLEIGATGNKVRQLQEQLNRIAKVYSTIPTLVTDGIYGTNTEAAVKQFQKIFNLPVTGVTDYPTWYKVSQIYVGVSGIGA